MTEIWVQIAEFPNYQVSSLGRVRRVGRSLRDRTPGAALRPTLDKSTGYLKVGLRRDGRKHTRAVHRLVCEAFNGPMVGMDACHVNGDKANNRVENLRWGTRSENNLDAVRHGTNKQAARTHCPIGHPLSLPNLVPSSLARGQRNCLSCSRERAAAYRAARVGVVAGGLR